MAQKIIGVEIGIAPVSENSAPQNEYGIRFPLCHKICGKIVPFHVGGLAVQNDDPFHVFELVVVHKPLPAFGKDGIKRNDGEDNRRCCDDERLLD